MICWLLAIRNFSYYLSPSSPSVHHIQGREETKCEFGVLYRVERIVLIYLNSFYSSCVSVILLFGLSRVPLNCIPRSSHTKQTRLDVWLFLVFFVALCCLFIFTFISIVVVWFFCWLKWLCVCVCLWWESSKSSTYLHENDKQHTNNLYLYFLCLLISIAPRQWNLWYACIVSNSTKTTTYRVYDV